MSTDHATAPRPRGRPRSEQAEQAIVRAVIDLLAAGVTVSGLSVEGVAARAGVGKATIYRRWRNKEALVIDALAAIKEPVAERPGQSVRDDLVRHVDGIRSRNTSPEGRIFASVVADLKRHPRLFRQYHDRIIEPRREVVRAVLRRGVATGELRPDLDIELALYLVAGPILFLAMTEPDAALPADLPARLVDAALDGLRTR